MLPPTVGHPERSPSAQYKGVSCSAHRSLCSPAPVAQTRLAQTVPADASTGGDLKSDRGNRRSAGLARWGRDGLLLLAISLGCSGANDSGRVSDVLLITLDTTRADVLTPYGAPAAATPALQRFAAGALVFEHASTPMGLTRPAHASMLTGLYPRAHGVRSNRAILAASHVTVQRELAAAGYQTAAFVSTPILGQRSGLLADFGHVDTPEEQARSGEQTVARALDWLAEADPERPLFLWLHLYDPHMPYREHGGLTPPLDPRSADRMAEFSWEQLETIASEENGELPQELVEHGWALYRGEVAFADVQLGHFFDQAVKRRASAADDRAMWIVSADHGECFSHGIFFAHAACLYEGSEHIPLIIRAPRLFLPGSRSDAIVSSLDVMPTVLHAVGLPVPPGLSGIPLQTQPLFAPRSILLQNARLRRERTPSGRAGIHQVAGRAVDDRARRGQVGIVDRDWKYLRDRRGGPESAMLFRRGDEAQDLVESLPDVAAKREAALVDLLGSVPRQPMAPVDSDEKLRRDLEALGYLD